MAQAPVIAIDGPGGAGKGTLCLRLAASLGWHVLDSGALYRALACAGGRAGLSGEAEWSEKARRLVLDFLPEGGEQRLILDKNQDITAEIRTEACGAAASRLAALPAVRAALLQRQRDFRREPGLVADGRDMGTVVFPGAQLKFFLTASAAERAKRRYKQLSDKGISATLADLSAKIEERDARDRARKIAPLRPAQDAIVIDTTRRDADGVFAMVAGHVARRFPVDAGRPGTGTPGASRGFP